ncbi:MAG: homoserine dehydrogenase [Alphaproteobacteria bacterium]|nr:homoserine dehydrogenase [Alphaproteobacteria bacterium]MDE1985650.1 homoserine dehydrogenase [Alphaproteobacteria bacterium]MDE2161843.1 homoserine dehydrogenase [Alphaproteobacteria bacterium]MDE2264547.1 homoserine dehydrogenase [Alphaproteobacteria bacterium]MDE2500143.1 homoserine dehydrogenase [Alphaproteobacteria bacterium]
MNKPLKIAIAGLGTVGGGVIKAMRAGDRALADRAGRRLEIVAMCARDNAKDRGFEITNWASDPSALVKTDADVVVELIGGEDGPALALVQQALKAGKHVVTANKALLARHGAKLASLAEEKRLALKFEAAVAGGIPIVKALRESLVTYGVVAVRGILNGTCNYILTQMEATGRPFADVLKDAQQLGYAEADPTLDVGGGDTAHKLALLAGLAFGTAPELDSMAVQGIAHITPEDIGFAREFGYRIKLLGIAKKTPRGIDQRVEPAMVSAGTPLADVNGAFNAVMADADAAGSFFFEGRGAGEAPTASAVIADIVDIARGNIGPVFGIPAHSLVSLTPTPSGSASSAFYLRFQVLDVPGVLAEIAGHLAEWRVSIESMIQRGRAPGEAVSIVMITHETTHAAVDNALKTIAASDKVIAPPCMIPMEAK